MNIFIKIFQNLQKYQNFKKILILLYIQVHNIDPFKIMYHKMHIDIYIESI